MAYNDDYFRQQGAAAPTGAPQPPASATAPYAAPAATAKPKGNRTWIFAIVALALVAVIAVSAWSCARSLESLGGTGGFDFDSTEPNTVAIITLDGTIDYDGSECSPEGLKELLDEAADDDNIEAIVLRVNSGGGTATAGEEMAAYVRQFDKPVVVSSASINASAAYEISSQADFIYTAKTTEIGAIGTNLSMVDYSQLLEYLGISFESFSSAPEKDSSYGRRALTDEERELYQQMVYEVNDAFIENVVDGRGMSEDDVRALANGMPYSGTAAVANGLADDFGTLEDACDKAAELAGIEGDYVTCDLYLYTPSGSSWLDLLSLDYEGSADARQVAALLEELRSHDGIAR